MVVVIHQQHWLVLLTRFEHGYKFQLAIETYQLFQVFINTEKIASLMSSIHLLDLVVWLATGFARDHPLFEELFVEFGNGCWHQDIYWSIHDFSLVVAEESLEVVVDSFDAGFLGVAIGVDDG